MENIFVAVEEVVVLIGVVEVVVVLIGVVVVLLVVVVVAVVGVRSVSGGQVFSLG